MKFVVLILFLLAFGASAFGQSPWQAKLDSRVVSYQTTDFGTVLVGTEKSLYALDNKTGERVWRVNSGKMSETAVTPVPGTDVILLSHDLGGRSRLDAIDVLTGERLWQSDKVKGDVMQLAVDPEHDLIALVLVKDARGHVGQTVKKKPVMHVLQMSTGDELWKRDFDGDVEMMPARFDRDGEVDFTLDNYRPPMIVDGRLFLYYEGATSYDARTGKEKEREKFKINEDGLALTEADPIVDDTRIYVSGRGKIRAIDRRTGQEVWSAKDLGITAEMVEVGQTIFVRTGGRFTRLKEGETEEKGPYGVSAIDASTGKTIWRFKGSDKGLTNFAFVSLNTFVLADRDEVMVIDANSGRRLAKAKHGIEDAAFVIVNESGQAVVGGKNEIAAFDSHDPRLTEIWRQRHTPPARGVLNIVGAIALRAASIYFRYGGLATSAIGLARTGVNIASAINSFRWSGLSSRGGVDLTTLASSAARNYVSNSFYAYGTLARDPSLLGRYGGFRVPNVTDVEGHVIGSVARKMMPSREDVGESIFERVDPSRQADRLADFLLRRRRLAELRSNYMYFYTDLPRPYSGKGIVGVNVHTGQDSRFVSISDPDPMFVIDEGSGLLYSPDGSRMSAVRIAVP